MLTIYLLLKYCQPVYFAFINFNIFCQYRQKMSHSAVGFSWLIGGLEDAVVIMSKPFWSWHSISYSPARHLTGVVLFGTDNEPANTSLPLPNPHILLLITSLTLKISHLSHSQYKPSFIKGVPEVRLIKVGHASSISLKEGVSLSFFLF